MLRFLPDSWLEGLLRPFLLGDPGKRGIRRALPVDAFYDEFKLVIEYFERQHAERVAFWDSKPTVSGCSRGEQRRKYDERRRLILPHHGIQLIELKFCMFEHGTSKRLRRIPVADEAVVRLQLAHIADRRTPNRTV